MFRESNVDDDDFYRDYLLTDVNGDGDKDVDDVKDARFKAADLSPTIVDCPRFGLVPVVNVDTFQTGTSFYPVVELKAIYIQDIYGNGSGDPNPQEGANATSFNVVVFPIEFVASLLGPNVGGTVDYFGGSRVPVLDE